MSGFTTHDLFSDPDRPSFLAELFMGRTRWDLLLPFPAQDPADRAVGDAEVARFIDLLEVLVDQETVERTGALPAGLVERLCAEGYLAMTTDRSLGGRGFSRMNLFRVVAAAASRSTAIAMMLGIENGIGASAYLPLTPAGPLRDLLRDRLRTGLVSALADTEPTGAANRRRYTTATRTDDGSGYLIDGAKVHVGNAPIANLLCTTATVSDGQIRLFFVDPDQPGVRVSTWHEFMGLRGTPNGGVEFSGAFVPADHVLVEPDFDERLTPGVTRVLTLGRMYLIVAPSLAIGRRCVEAAREFVNRRRVDDRPLGDYEQVRRLVASSLADVFMMESLADWVMLAEDHGLNPLFEQIAAKNVASVACWRVVERTMSLLASEGLETATSKTRRGITANPVERLFRDARGLRISGGVDFQLDYWLARNLAFAGHYTGRRHSGGELAVHSLLGGLSAANAEHTRFTQDRVREFSRVCADLAARHPDPEELFAQERLNTVIGGIASELLAMSVVLASGARRTAQGHPHSGELADIFCTEARRRLADADRELADLDRPDRSWPAYGSVSGAWLADEPVWSRA